MTAVRPTMDFDPALERLPLIDDPTAVADLLAPGRSVRKVRRLDTKYQPGTRCVAAYRIETDDPASPVFGAVVIGPDQITAHLAQADPALPTLTRALDGRAVARRRDFPGEGGRRPERCRAELVRYKPGVRCVVRYDLAGQLRSSVHFGKVLAAGPGGQPALVQELSSALHNSPGAPVVQPVTEWADLQMIVQPAMSAAREVHDLIGAPNASPEARRALITRVGTALAAVHSTPLPSAPVRSFADDLDELRDYLPGLHLADPSLGDRYEALLHRVSDPAEPGKQLVTSHGAFRTDQMMVAGDDLVLIDLDTVCRAEPARDLGNLLAYLDWKAIRSPGDAAVLAELGSGFLDGYASRLPLPPSSRLATQRAACLLKIAGRRVRSLTVTEWPLLPVLLDAADRQIAAHTLEPT